MILIVSTKLDHGDVGKICQLIVIHFNDTGHLMQPAKKKRFLRMRAANEEKTVLRTQISLKYKLKIHFFSSGLYTKTLYTKYTHQENQSLIGRLQLHRVSSHVIWSLYRVCSHVIRSPLATQSKQPCNMAASYITICRPQHTSKLK